MPQTILAVLALMIIVTFSLSTQREVLDSQREMIANEMEVMATGVALQAMETIRTRYFDKVVGEDPGGVYAVSDFEPSGDWDNGTCKVFHGGSNECNDLDDFHGMNTATIPFEMRDGAGNTETVPFNVDVQVQYVGVDMQPTGGARTLRKEVTVFVQDVSASGQPFLRNPIHLSRVFAYNFGATERGHGGGRGNGGVIGDRGEFEDNFEWLMQRLENDSIRNTIANQVENWGWDTLGSAIRNQNESGIREILEGSEEAREALDDYREDIDD